MIGIAVPVRLCGYPPCRRCRRLRSFDLFIRLPRSKDRSLRQRLQGKENRCRTKRDVSLVFLSRANGNLCRFVRPCATERRAKTGFTQKMVMPACIKAGGEEWLANHTNNWGIHNEH